MTSSERTKPFFAPLLSRVTFHVSRFRHPDSTFQPSAVHHLVSSLFGLWLMIGLFVDGWAHVNLRTLETFFTPWHGVLYSGLALNGAWFALLARAGYRSGARGIAVLPAGYELGVLGLGIFAIGGLGDMLWHIAFGIEQDVDALLSPTHLLLFLGVALILTSPVRNAWRTLDDPAPGFRVLLPATIALALTMALIGFFTMYASAFNSFNPFEGHQRMLTRIARDYREVKWLSDRSGLTSLMVSTVLVVSPALVLLRRWPAPFGTFALLTVIPAVLLTSLEEFELLPLAGAALAGGLAMDLLSRWLQPSPERPVAWRLFATLCPLILWSGYFVIAAVTLRVGWSAELTFGSIAFSGFVGYGLGFLTSLSAHSWSRSS